MKRLSLLLLTAFFLASCAAAWNPGILDQWWQEAPEERVVNENPVCFAFLIEPQVVVLKFDAFILPVAQWTQKGNKMIMHQETIEDDAATLRFVSQKNGCWIVKEKGQEDLQVCPCEDTGHVVN